MRTAEPFFTTEAFMVPFASDNDGCSLSHGISAQINIGPWKQETSTGYLHHCLPHVFHDVRMSKPHI